MKLTSSLVPRLFPPPVFDHLQYANTEGEDLGDLFLVYCLQCGRDSFIMELCSAYCTRSKSFLQKVNRLYAIDWRHTTFSL